VLNFGPFAADRVKYWLVADYLVREGGMCVADLNAWLAAGLAGPSEGHAAHVGK
jgi:hypothetical protein